jgi:hypothetical protein
MNWAIAPALHPLQLPGWTSPHSLGDSLGAGMDVELFVDLLDVVCDRIDADEELFRNLAIRLPLNNLIEDFIFALGQRIVVVGLTKQGDDFASDTCRHGRAPVVDVLDGLYDFCWGRIF